MMGTEVRERVGEVGTRKSLASPCGSSKERCGATTHYRRHHVSTSSFEEVGVATSGLMRFSYGDDEEELGGAAVEEVLGVALLRRCSGAALWEGARGGRYRGGAVML
jgi:hypothetical protein